MGKPVLQLFAFLGDRFFKSLGTFFAHFFPGLFGHLFFHFARVLDLRGDLRGIKPGYSHFEVVQLRGKCGLILFLGKQDNCRLAVENTVAGFLQQGCIVCHVTGIDRAADQHAHATPEKDPKRPAEDTDQAAN